MAIAEVPGPRVVLQVVEAVCLVTPRDYMGHYVIATAASAPIFDNAHVVYTTDHIDAVSRSTTGDNSGGAQDLLHLEPTLTRGPTTGFSTRRETAARTPALHQPRRRRWRDTPDPEPVAAVRLPWQAGAHRGQLRRGMAATSKHRVPPRRPGLNQARKRGPTVVVESPLQPVQEG